MLNVERPNAQEKFLGNGQVQVDGKVMWVSDLPRYRTSSSSRERSRTRGGVQIRSKASWCDVQGLFLLCFP